MSDWGKAYDTTINWGTSPQTAQPWGNVVLNSPSGETNITGAPKETISAYTQTLVFDSYLNSINYYCNEERVHSCYGTNQENITDFVTMLNSNPPVQSQACFLDFGVYYDNGDGRVRLEMPLEVYNNFCPDGQVDLIAIYD